MLYIERLMKSSMESLPRLFAELNLGLQIMVIWYLRALEDEVCQIVPALLVPMIGQMVWRFERGWGRALVSVQMHRRT